MKITKILTGKDQFSVKKRGGYRAFVHSLLLMRYRIAPDWELCDPGLPPGSSGVTAWINQGNWAADCECGGSMIVEPGEPYICPDCCNAAQGRKARAGVGAEERAEIEAVILERPFPRNRNWLTTETLKDLVEQNIEKGDVVPVKILAKVTPKEPIIKEPPVEMEP